MSIKNKWTPILLNTPNSRQAAFSREVPLSCESAAPRGILDIEVYYACSGAADGPWQQFGLLAGSGVHLLKGLSLHQANANLCHSTFPI